MVFVPAGPFHMGSTAEEIEVVRQECRICPQDWFDWEKVPHQVELPAYWIDQYEVTNRQYRRFIAAGGYDRRDL